MRKLNSENYQNVLQRLERMASGISHHNNEARFPATLIEGERRQMKLDLEAARSDYEEKQRAADLAHIKFDSLLKAANGQLAKDDDALRGFYGKDNPVVANFGTIVVTRTRSNRKSKVPVPEPAGSKS